MKRSLGIKNTVGTKALAIPAADHYSTYVKFPWGLAEFPFDYYEATSIDPSAFFFCQIHIVMLNDDRLAYEDLVACTDAILVDVAARKAQRGEEGEEEAVGRMLHSKLRMEWYEKAGVLGKKGPTPSEPHCFEGAVSIGCLFYLHHTDKGFHHGYYRTYSTLLEEYREKEEVNLLEIGVKDGQSMSAWMQYFKGEGEGCELMTFGERMTRKISLERVLWLTPSLLPTAPWQGSRFFGLGYGEGEDGEKRDLVGWSFARRLVGWPSSLRPSYS